MRGWVIALAVVLAACAGYAFALWLHDLALLPSEPAHQTAPLVVPAPRRIPAAEFHTPGPEPKRDPKVRSVFRRLTRELRRLRVGFEEQALINAGWRRFDHEIPEDISYRGHDFLREVAAATKQRWFSPQEREAYDAARAAWQRTLVHRRRLLRDHVMQAGESQLANLAYEPSMAGLHLLALHEPPFLLVYASEQPLSRWDLAPDERTSTARLAVERRATLGMRILRRNAVVLRAVRKELRRRYEKRLRLGDLTAQYGGRPDLPYGVRSFADGVTLVALTFPDGETARRHKSDHLFGWWAQQGLQLGSGMLVSLPQVAERRTTPFWSTWFGREAARQLLYWYGRQRNRWRKPRPGEGFLDLGVAAWLGAFQLDAQGRAIWSGVAGRRLQDMQLIARRMRTMGNEYRLFTVRELVSPGSRRAIQQWVANEWQLSAGLALSLYRQQAWALAHFLNREDGGHRGAFLRFLDLALHRETGGGRTERAFAEAFRLRDEDDWRDLDEAFHKHVRERLMKKDPLPYLKDPPPLETWDR